MKRQNGRYPKYDWEKIRIEYVSGLDTMRGLARKYNLSVSTISDRAKREHWKDDCKSLSASITQKCEQQMIERATSNQEKAQVIIDELLVKMGMAVKGLKKDDVTAMKNLVQSMKDLKDLGVFDTGKADKEVVIRIEGGEDYVN